MERKGTLGHPTGFRSCKNDAGRSYEHTHHNTATIRIFSPSTALSRVKKWDVERMLVQRERVKVFSAVFMLGALIPYCWAILPFPLSLLTYGVAIGGLFGVVAVLGWWRSAPYIAASAAVGTALILYEGLNPNPSRYMIVLMMLAAVAFHIAYDLLFEATVHR